MAASQDGDRAAYELLLREILPFLRAMVLRRIRSSDRAEDAVQDILLTVHRVRHTYDPKRPFKPWLATIAQRRCVDLYRRQRRVGASEVSDDKAYETFADPLANRGTEAFLAADGLGDAIAGLPNQQREALKMLKLQEMSLAEASQASGRSVSALKVSVHRAIKSLRALLVGD